jgi:hypothetical protein
MPVNNTVGLRGISQIINQDEIPGRQRLFDLRQPGSFGHKGSLPTKNSPESVQQVQPKMNAS